MRFRSKPSREYRGFTLIEILVAISIFALIGLASAQMLTSVLSAESVVSDRSERLFALQRAIQVLDRDFSQIADRGIRDAFGDDVAALYTDPNVPDAVELSRIGWSNPLGVPRGSIQRVRWVLEGDRLERHYWDQLDRTEESEVRRQVVLEGVRAFRLEFSGEGDETTLIWPPRPQTRFPGSDEDATSPELRDADAAREEDSEEDRTPRRNRIAAQVELPIAIRVQLEAAPWGTIERFYALPVRGVAPGPDESRPDAEDNEFGDGQSAEGSGSPETADERQPGRGRR